MSTTFGQTLIVVNTGQPIRLWMIRGCRQSSAGALGDTGAYETPATAEGRCR